MYRFFAPLVRFSTATLASVALLGNASVGLANNVAWCSCSQPASCGCAQPWTGVPLDGTGMGLGEGMGMDGVGTPAPMAEPGLNLSQQFGGGGQFFVTSNTGYIDSAVPFTHFRMRYDDAHDNPFPDRAEFFYGQIGPLGGPGLLLTEPSVDYQEILPYFEYAWSPYASVFIETPVRFLDPEISPSESGFGDIVTGFKWAYCARPNWDYVTFQFKVYAPTGDVAEGLGTGHVSLEPGVLFFHRLTDRTVLEGEVRDWIPISDSQFNGEDYAGNVLRYGLGLGHDLFQGCNACRQPTRLTAVTEFVGWTILNGQGFDGRAFLNTGGDPADFVFDASGDTIVNVKIGARYTSGPKSFYAGYGRALTGDPWYEDLLRLEYRHAF